jgi:hypothetical protein
MPVGRLLGAAGAGRGPAPGPAAGAATPESSTTNRLQDRREVAAGDRAYVEGFQDGRLTVTVASRHPRGAGQRTGS